MGVTVHLGQPIEDLDVLDVTTTVLAAAGVYTSVWRNAEGFKIVVGMAYATHETIGAVVFTTGGGALDDMTASGPYTNTPTRDYRVQIDAAGANDTFTWSNDGGVTWEAAGVLITGALQTLEDGVGITFGAITGHAVGDRWDFTTTREDGTLYIEQSQDGVNADSFALVKVINSDDAENSAYKVEVIAPYVRMRYVNSGIVNTVLRASINGKVV